MVGQRRGLLDYLKKTDIERYRALIEKLGIRSNSTAQRKEWRGVEGILPSLLS